MPGRGDSEPESGRRKEGGGRSAVRMEPEDGERGSEETFMVVSLWYHFAPGGERLLDRPKTCVYLRLRRAAEPDSGSVPGRGPHPGDFGPRPGGYGRGFGFEFGRWFAITTDRVHSRNPCGVRTRDKSAKRIPPARRPKEGRCAGAIGLGPSGGSLTYASVYRWVSASRFAGAQARLGHLRWHLPHERGRYAFGGREESLCRATGDNGWYWAPGGGGEEWGTDTPRALLTVALGFVVLAFQAGWRNLRDEMPQSFAMWRVWDWSGPREREFSPGGPGDLGVVPMALSSLALGISVRHQTVPASYRTGFKTASKMRLFGVIRPISSHFDPSTSVYCRSGREVTIVRFQYQCRGQSSEYSIVTP